MIRAVIRFFGFVIILCCLFIILLAVGYRHIQNVFPGHIQNMFAETMGTPVALQSAKLDIVNTQILIEGLQFYNPEGFPKGPLAKIPRIFIDFEFESFLVQRIILNYVEMDCQETHILRDSSGEMNWFHIRSFKEGGKFKRTGFMAWMKGWPMEIHRFVVSIGRNTYTDFSQRATFKKFRILNLRNLEFENLSSMMEMTKIITWETLIRVDQDELKEAFDLVEQKVEEKLGTRKEFLAKWHPGKNSEQLIEETKPPVKAVHQPPLF